MENIRSYQQAKNATIMMVSHSMEEVARLTDRLLVMNHGQVAMDGTPKEVFQQSQALLDMGLDIPVVTRVFLRLHELGPSVDTSVYSVEQAVAALKIWKGGVPHA